MISITSIIQMYFAFLVVIFLHEIGHVPEKIKFKVFPPMAAAMRAKYRLGGLIVNALLFLGIFYYKPESLFLNMIGLVSWVHFILYSIVGSIIPEPKSSQVNISTYVFDDVPNEYWYIFIPLGLYSYIFFNSYFLSILWGLL